MVSLVVEPILLQILKWEVHVTSSHREVKLARILRVCHTKTNTAAKEEQASSIMDLLWIKCQVSLVESKLIRANRAIVGPLQQLWHYQTQFRCREESAISSELHNNSLTLTMWVAILSSSSSFNKCTNNPLITSWALLDHPQAMVKTNMPTQTSS